MVNYVSGTIPGVVLTRARGSMDAGALLGIKKFHAVIVDFTLVLETAEKLLAQLSETKLPYVVYTADPDKVPKDIGCPVYAKNGDYHQVPRMLEYLKQNR